MYNTCDFRLAKRLVGVPPNLLELSGHGVQKPYKNTAPIFTGSGVLRKVDMNISHCFHSGPSAW